MLGLSVRQQDFSPSSFYLFLCKVAGRHIRTAEPAWHRQRRKARTRARFLISGFLAGAPVNNRRVDLAISLLKKHHSPSTLAWRAERRRQEAPADMAHAWCELCQENRSNRLSYCGQCGTQLQTYTQADSQPPWKSWQAATSPRRRWQEDWGQEGRNQSPRRRPSPRRKGKDGPSGRTRSGKGTQQPAAKSKGKGPGEKKAVPSTKELPAPPTVEGIAKPTVSVKSEPTEEKSSSSSALLTQLMASRESLPPDIQALVDKEVEMDTKASTKQLHRLVSQQGSARRELQAISKMRDSFLLEWNSYICQLCTMVEQQLQAKAATLQELDQAEEAWRAQLSQATSSIAQASGVAPQSLVDTGEPIDLDTEQEDAEQAVAMAAAEASKKRKMIADLEAQEKSISAALAQARTVATESAEALRERTPRRSSRQEGKDFP